MTTDNIPQNAPKHTQDGVHNVLKNNETMSNVLDINPTPSVPSILQEEHYDYDRNKFKKIKRNIAKFLIALDIVSLFMVIHTFFRNTNTGVLNSVEILSPSFVALLTLFTVLFGNKIIIFALKHKII